MNNSLKLAYSNTELITAVKHFITMNTTLQAWQASCHAIHIGLGLNRLKMTNTPAYYNREFFTAVND